ncbi:hypothetical protein K9N50_05905 [bacterium]|nr:hypothetical protein [bacterium]
MYPPPLYRMIMLGITAIIGCLISYVIIKSSNLRNLFKFFAIFVIVLFSFSLLNFISEFRQSSQNDELIADVSGFDISNISFNEKDKRDIYFIIFDAYMGHKQLQKYLNFDNSVFVGELRKRGFFVAENSHSNYPKTIVSMPATLNMEYLPKKTMSQNELQYNLWNNKVMRLFSMFGYKTINVSIGFCLKLKDTYKTFDTILSPFSEGSLGQTYIGEVIRRIVLIKQGEKRVPKSFEVLYSLVNRKEDNFYFTYAHIVCPHGPYYYKPNGELHRNTGSDYQKASGRDKYTDSIIYLNKNILALVDTMLQKDSKPIIILQADHGNNIGFDINKEWAEPSYELVDSRLGVLNAIYFPDEDYSLLYDSISTINTFRVVLKKYADPTILLHEDNYHFLKRFSRDGEDKLYHITDLPYLEFGTLYE